MMAFGLVLPLTILGQEEKRPEPPSPQANATAAPSDAPEKPATKDNASDKPASKEDKPVPLKPGKVELATFGGGCFWCTEAVCEVVPGVYSAVSGYSGGSVPFPSYDAVCSGNTGHAEVVQVAFDPAIISYEKLLEVFFRSHDPTTPNAQGPDVGTQYRSIILYHSEQQMKSALKVAKELKARKVIKGDVVTQLVPFVAFFPAEAYHQDYYRNHPFEPYSMVYIEPKFDLFRKMMKGSRAAQPKSRNIKASGTVKAATDATKKTNEAGPESASPDTAAAVKGTKAP